MRLKIGAAIGGLLVIVAFALCVVASVYVWDWKFGFAAFVIMVIGLFLIARWDEQMMMERRHSPDR